MSKSIEVKYSDYFQLPNPSLKSYFGRVRRGNLVEYRTPFYPGRTLDEVLKGWSPTLETISGTWPTLIDFENDLFKKVGPMSYMKPLADRMEDIDSYYDGILLHQTPISQSAIAAVLKEWSQVRGLNMYPQSKTIELMKKSTNSGSPYFTKRKLVVDDTFPLSASISGEDVFQDLPSGRWKSAAILGWRGQEGGRDLEDTKQRVVWMFPFGINLLELQVYQPLIAMAQRHGLVPAWISMESVDQSITRLFDTKGSDDLIICTDFTKFDQHFGPSCQDAAKTILAGILSKGHVQDWLSDVFPIKYTIPLNYDYGLIRFGRHGMGSGSGGTNVDETLVHRSLQYEAAQSIGSKLNPNSMCLGDDGVLSYPGITIENVVKSYTNHGLVMNTDKQYLSSQDCTYLRRWHHTNYRNDGVCVGVYSTYRALGRLMEQERYYDPKKWGPKMVALRQLSILENVKWHPLREEFVQYCMKGDKYRLGIDIPGFLDEIIPIANEAIEYMPDFLGYVQTEMSGKGGISEWWILNYLKSLA